MEADTFKKRLKRFQSELSYENVFACLIVAPRDLYYYSGISQPANLWIPSYGEPILFTRRAHEMAKQNTFIRNIYQASKLTEILGILDELNVSPAKGDKIGVEIDVLPGQLLLSLQKTFKFTELVNISHLILKQRFIKDENEIANIKSATELWKKGHEELMNQLKPGKKEYELSAAMEYGVRKSGGDGTVWFRRWDAKLPGGGIVASGENSWVVSGHAMTVTGVGLSQGLPWGASSRVLQEGDMVVADYGVCFQTYHCDMARTYCIGKPSEKQKDLWKRLLDLHLSVIDYIKPYLTGEQIYLKAAQLAEDMGMSEFFMGVGNDRGNYIGHSIGLELDEWPVLGIGAKEPIPPGAIITIEPKFMVPELGAVMVEDDILITNNGTNTISDLERELFYLS